MHLLLAPFLARIVLVEPGKVAIVALVERLVPDGLQLRLADRVQNELAGLLRALQRRGEGDVEFEAAVPQLLAGCLGLGSALRGLGGFYRNPTAAPAEIYSALP